MNDLEKIFFEHKGNLIHKWSHYFGIYDRYFSRYRGKELTILEIGVFKGGSLQMWQRYFGDKVRIIGVDIDPDCLKYAGGNIEVVIGSQDDPAFLESLKKKYGKVDIVLDDGGHMMNQLKVSFEHLYDMVKDDGIYLVEDLHTCYWYLYDGGLRRGSNFMEYTKRLLDGLNEWHFKQEVSAFTKSTYSVHFYDSIIVFEKRPMQPPQDLFSGDKTMLNTTEPVLTPMQRFSGYVGRRWKYSKFLLHRWTGINIP